MITCEVLRTAAPAISTILARETLDGELLGAAMKAGARDVVHHTDTGRDDRGARPRLSSCSWRCAAPPARCT